MKKAIVLALLLVMITLTGCSSTNDPMFIVSEWGRTVLKETIDQTYNADYVVGYKVSVAESEYGEYEELFTIYKVENKLLRIHYDKGKIKEYPQIKCVNYGVSDGCVVIYKNQAIAGVSPINKYEITHIYSTNTEDFMKLFEFKVYSYEFDMSKDSHGYKLYLVNKMPKMQVNPLKNIVMDYSDITYDGNDFSIGYDSYGLDLMSKIICDGKELMIKMEISFYEEDEIYPTVLEYLDSKDSFQTFTEWPDRYLEILNSKLRNQPIPVPDGISMYNEIVESFGEECKLKVFLSDDGFIDNYANKLESNGFYLSPLAKGNYFKKVTSGDQEFYVHIYLQKRGEYDYIIFTIKNNDRSVYDLRY